MTLIPDDALGRIRDWVEMEPENHDLLREANDILDDALREILKLMDEKREELASPCLHRLRAEVTFVLQEAYRRVEALKRQTP